MSAPARTSFAIQALTSNFSAASATGVPHEIMWTKPNPGTYKLNLDAAFHDDGTGAVGVVLRNNSGEAIAGAAEPISHVLNAGSAESLAMLKGIELLKRLGCSEVTVESDCLELINACTGVTELFGPSSATLAEIFAKVQHIAGISFQHCKRDANLVAHNLAKHSYESKSVIFWDDVPP